MTGGSPAVSDCERGGGLLANTTELAMCGACGLAATMAKRSSWAAGARMLGAGAVGGGRWAGQLGRLSCTAWSGCWAAAADCWLA
jgi:hypothetical protein